MNYEQRRENGEDHDEHLEDVRGRSGGGFGGEHRPGRGGKGGLGVVASADADAGVRRGGMPGLDPKAGGRRKAFEDAMAWLFSPESDPDAWMFRGCDVSWFKKKL